MAALKHDHKLKKHTFKSGNETFFCALPDCSYKVKPGLALGKRVLCWRCEKPFILTDYALRLVKPHCNNCHRHKPTITVGSNEGEWVGPPSGEAHKEISELVRIIQKKNTELDTEAKAVESSLRDRLSGAVRAIEEEGEI